MSISVPLMSEPRGWLKEELKQNQIPYRLVDPNPTNHPNHQIPLHLLFNHEEQLSLIHPDLGPFQVDFSSLSYRKRILLGKKELIARALALGAKSPVRVFDASCGLAEDALFICRLGACVVSMERNPLIYLLLRSAIYQNPQLDILKNWELLFGDSLQQQASFYQSFDVLYFDPMFPEKKKSALPRKEMQIFQSLLGHQDLSNEEIKRLQALGVPRVVVKRPLKAPPLWEPVTHPFLGKAIRFDMYSKDSSRTSFLT